MKATRVTNLLTIALLTAGICVAQTSNDNGQDKGKDAKAKAVATDAVPAPAPTVATDGDDKSIEADAILPYYDNYLKEYRLGPSDQISVEVFGQCPDYCKTGITIPPNARISYPLVREGILVAGENGRAGRC